MPLQQYISCNLIITRKLDLPDSLLEGNVLNCPQSHLLPDQIICNPSYNECHSVFPEPQSNLFAVYQEHFQVFQFKNVPTGCFAVLKCYVSSEGVALKGFQLIVLNVSKLIRHIASLSFCFSSNCVIHMFYCQSKAFNKIVFMFPSQSFSRCRGNRKGGKKKIKCNLLGEVTSFCNCLLLSYSDTSHLSKEHNYRKVSLA